MFRQMFWFSSTKNGAPENGNHRNGSANLVALASPNDQTEPVEAKASLESGGAKAVTSADIAGARYFSFEEIYQNAAVKPARLPYTILKVAEMTSSPHLAGMAPETKRCSLLMALEAAGAEVEDLLQDAVVRQRALNDCELAQQTRLREFETAKTEENRRLQEDLDRLTAEYMSLMQANLDEVAREQDQFRAWQKRKDTESQRITDAATFCVPQGIETSGGGLTAVLQRATTPRR